MELLAPEAVLMNDEEAGVLLKQAYVAKQGSDRDYDQFTWMLRKKLGPRNDDFTLPDYEGNEMSLSSLHGRVILLAFWFPT